MNNTNNNEELMKELKVLQAVSLLTLAYSSYRPAPRKAWYEKGIVGDLTWGLR
jgi:hypothetical protein